MACFSGPGTTSVVHGTGHETNKYTITNVYHSDDPYGENICEPLIVKKPVRPCALVYVEAALINIRERNAMLAVPPEIVRRFGSNPWTGKNFRKMADNA